MRAACWLHSWRLQPRSSPAPSPCLLPPLPPDAAWVRYSAVSGLLRLARGYDTAMPASLYASLAVALQEPLPEPRAAMTSKLAKAVERLAGGKVRCGVGGGGKPRGRNRHAAPEFCTARHHLP